jgi:hypothetical protein
MNAGKSGSTAAYLSVFFGGCVTTCVTQKHIVAPRMVHERSFGLCACHNDRVTAVASNCPSGIATLLPGLFFELSCMQGWSGYGASDARQNFPRFTSGSETGWPTHILGKPMEPMRVDSNI